MTTTKNNFIKHFIETTNKKELQKNLIFSRRHLKDNINLIDIIGNKVYYYVKTSGNNLYIYYGELWGENKVVKVQKISILKFFDFYFKN